MHNALVGHGTRARTRRTLALPASECVSYSNAMSGRFQVISVGRWLDPLISVAHEPHAEAPLVVSPFVLLSQQRQAAEAAQAAAVRQPPQPASDSPRQPAIACSSADPSVHLSRQGPPSQPATAAEPHSQPAAGSDIAPASSADAWTPYQLPEARALLAIHRAAALRRRQLAAAAPVSGLKSALCEMAVLQAQLTGESLAAATAECAEVWPDSWVRSGYLQI